MTGVTGNFDAPSSSDEDVAGGVGWNASAMVLFIGAEVSGDFSGDEYGDTKGGCLGVGGQVGVNLNRVFMNVTKSMETNELEPLKRGERLEIKASGGCKTTYENVEPDEIVDNPDTW